MAHQLFTDHNSNTNKKTQSGARPVSMIAMGTNNTIALDNYEYELKKIMEQDRHILMGQQQIPIDAILPSPRTTYVGATDGTHKYVQQAQYISGLPLTSPAIPNRLTSVKPLRIIIIRHAERADAVLGSDWSKKSFDRTGRYIRFSEHLPESLPSRSYLHHYVIDVPLTNRGHMHAFKTGKALNFNGYAADICYTSPSLRCVQSANAILTGMGRKNIPMRLEPGLFECYLNDFKRTLCFMTKHELAANGYNIDQSYQSIVSFMRPHDSQLDYYERCRALMDIIIERHQTTGGTILVVAHAPSLEGLTRHLTGGKFQPEKLFDIARRVPFLAMTVIEKNGPNTPWLFRTRPLQTNTPLPSRDFSFELNQTSTPTITKGPVNHPLTQPISSPQHYYQQTSPVPAVVAAYAQTNNQVQKIANNENQKFRLTNVPVSIDPKKIVKSSTAPNLRMSNSFSNMFRVI